MVNRCVYFEVRCELPIISINGKVNKAMLLASDPNWREAVDVGMPWLCIDPIFEEHYPQLVILIIEADNLSTQIAKQDNVWTLCWKVHKAATLQVRLQKCSEEAINWEIVKKSVCRTELIRAPEIPDVIAFVKDWSGGLQNPWLLRDIDSWAKSQKVVRNVPCNVLGKLASLKLGVGVGGCWRAAVLKAALSCDVKYTLNNGDNISSYIVPADIVAMQNRHKEYVLEADKLMITFREIVRAEKELDKTEAIKLIGQHDVRSVGHVLQRPTAYGSFNSLLDIAYQVSAAHVEAIP